MAATTMSPSSLLLAPAPRVLSISSSPSSANKLCCNPPFTAALPRPGNYQLSVGTWRRRKDSSERCRLWSVSAAPEDSLPSVVEKASDVIPAATEDGITSTVVSSLLLVAFVGLSILTVGVIYLAVQDFLQKREREKFEKEETTKKKKDGKKRPVRAKTGPRGFGQKIEEDDE